MATKRYDFKFHCTKDAEIIQRLDAQPNKQQYIRMLIATDILADSLKDAFQIFNRDHAHALDPDEFKESIRIDFYNENCPAINNLDPDVDLCSGCKFKVYTDNYSDCSTCTIQSAWETYWEHKQYIESGCAIRDYPADFKGLKKEHLNSVYGRMLKDPFKDDVINNMLEDKQ